MGILISIKSETNRFRLVCQNYFCPQDRYNAEEYVRHIRLALDELHANLPRTIVNLNPMFDITPLKTMSTGEDCDIFQE